MVRHHQSKIVFQCGAEESSHFDLEESMIPEGQDAADRWADILARTPWWRPEMREDLRNSVLSMRLKKV